jgi:hypothetical protein
MSLRGSFRFRIPSFLYISMFSFQGAG